MKTLIFADLSEEQVQYLENLADDNSITFLITHPTKKKNFKRIRKIFKKALTEQELNQILDVRENLIAALTEDKKIISNLTFEAEENLPVPVEETIHQKSEMVKKFLKENNIAYENAEISEILEKLINTPPVLCAEDLPIPAHLQVPSALSAREKRDISMQTVISPTHIHHMSQMVNVDVQELNTLKNDYNIVTFADALDMHQLPANIRQVIEGWL